MITKSSDRPELDLGWLGDQNQTLGILHLNHHRMRISLNCRFCGCWQFHVRKGHRGIGVAMQVCSWVGGDNIGTPCTHIHLTCRSDVILWPGAYYLRKHLVGYLCKDNLVYTREVLGAHYRGMVGFPVPFTNRISSRRLRTPPPATFIFRSSKGFARIASTPGRLLQLHSFFLRFRMPRKKNPPPSSLPPRRSTRGASKSTSLIDGEDVETPMVPLVGLGDTQYDNTGSLQQPFLSSGSNLCNVNKDVSIVPSVTVSLDESEKVLGSINKDEFLENSAAVGVSLAEKPGFAGNSAGLSDLDSSGSLHPCCGNNPSPVNETGGPRTVFSPHVPSSGDGITPSHTMSEGENVSQLPDVHVPESRLETESEVHGIDDSQLVLGVDSEVGVHASVGIDGEATSREGNATSFSSDVQVGTDGVDTPMQPIDRVIRISGRNRLRMVVRV
ncbi:hypothetical protein L1987_04464 [Smallanthus sonchifolius]|uniref:Uncharacterized protein n=1 Tax=Smallanthus sonchifolius TaxID=185202 RepID=A0ACB9JT12_9ASTR|nr:hypothetical protein L1987_04464 [Smallanthus sonchifolius]